MSGGGRHWTTSEARRLHELRAEGARTKNIARELGRSVDSINSFLRYVPSFRDQPKGRKPIERKMVPEPTPEIDPSEQLRIATLSAIVRFANDNRLDVDTAATFLLSKGAGQ